jgi:hypothetical protein
MRVVVREPPPEGPGAGARTSARVPPAAFCSQWTDHPLGVGGALRGVLAGQRGLAPAAMAGRQDGGGRRLAAGRTHARPALAPGLLGAWAVDSQITGLGPRGRGAPPPRRVPPDRLGVPREDHHEGAPAHAFTQAFGHRAAPPRSGRGGVGVAASRRPCGVQVAVGPHPQRGLAPPPHAPLLVHRQWLHDAPLGPDAPGAPARGRGLERPEARQHRRSARGGP